jgi:hypothetical protein
VRLLISEENIRDGILGIWSHIEEEIEAQEMEVPIFGI